MAQTICLAIANFAAMTILWSFRQLWFYDVGCEQVLYLDFQLFYDYLSLQFVSFYVVQLLWDSINVIDAFLISNGGLPLYTSLYYVEALQVTISFR